MGRLSIGRTDGKRQPVSGRSLAVADQREDVVAFEALPAVQKLELDHEREAHDLAPQLLDEIDLRPRGTSRREQIVVDDHARAGLDRVRMQLERVEAVLERVLDADRAPGELP